MCWVFNINRSPKFKFISRYIFAIFKYHLNHSAVPRNSLLIGCVCAIFRKKAEVSVLRAALRLRDEPSRAHPAAPSRNPRAMSVLLAHVHAQQHGAPAHRARAQDGAQHEDGGRRKCRGGRGGRCLGLLPAAQPQPVDACAAAGCWLQENLIYLTRILSIHTHVHTHEETFTLKKVVLWQQDSKYERNKVIYRGWSHPLRGAASQP